MVKNKQFFSSEWYQDGFQKCTMYIFRFQMSNSSVDYWKNADEMYKQLPHTFLCRCQSVLQTVRERMSVSGSHKTLSIYFKYCFRDYFLKLFKDFLKLSDYWGQKNRIIRIHIVMPFLCRHHLCLALKHYRLTTVIFFSQKLKSRIVDRALLGIISGMDVSGTSVILGLASLNEPLPGKTSCCILLLPSAVSSIKSIRLFCNFGYSTGSNSISWLLEIVH